MKKVFAFFALLITGILGMQAQEEIKWGVTGGLNFSTFSITGFDNRIGVHAGIRAEKDLPQLAEGIYLDMGALLSLKGTKIDKGSAGSIKFNPYYIEIPVHMGYKYAINEHISIFGNFGPYFAFRLFGKAKIKSDLVEDDAFKAIFGNYNMKRFDFGVGLRSGVEFRGKYQVALGYDWGFMNTIKGSSNKNRNLMMSFVYFI